MVGCALDMFTRELDRVPDGRPPSQILRPDRYGPPRRVAGAALPGLSVGGVPGATGACARCVETGRTCPSCVQRRRFAWSLVMERKESLQTAASILGLEQSRVQELVAAEQDRRELRSLRSDSIPVDRTRAAIADALARDPDRTIADIAGWLEMQQADFERAFLGKGRNGGRAKRRVNVTNASRLMIALGRAPNELEGC
jgi:hypothetical protein